jgi:hypothetical protein
VTIRLRIEVENVPGALARVAGVIADLGGNIHAVEVFEVNARRAVDEIDVELPTGEEPGMAALRHRFEEAGAGTLLSCEQTPLHADPMVRVLRALAGWERASLHDHERLDQLIGDLCGTRVAWVEEMPDALRRDVARLALERGGPVVRRVAHQQAPGGPLLPEEGWLAAIPDCPIGPMLVAFAIRPLARPFSMTEIRRTEALLGLLRWRRSGSPGSASEPVSSSASASG